MVLKKYWGRGGAGGGGGVGKEGMRDKLACNKITFPPNLGGGGGGVG